jgi:hypothetical protein
MNLGIERLGQGEKIAAGSAIALFVCMFLSWFNFGYTAGSAWESLHYISPILVIAIVATLGIALAEMREFDLGDVSGGLVVFVLGSLSALLILYRLIDPISTAGVDGGSTSASVEAGAFLGLLAALGIAVGGYVITDGKAIDRLKALLPSGPGTSPVSPPPPALPAPSPTLMEASAPTPKITVVEPPKPALAPTPESVPAPDPPTPEAAPTTPDAAPTTPDAAPTTPDAEEPRSVFCEGCGGRLRAQDRFCRKCGHQQVQVAP